MKSVLYRPSWQKLRVSCLAANHPSGGFTTTEGTKDNLERLNLYVFFDPAGIKADADAMGIGTIQEHACRVWRVLNLLNATRMGFSGQGLEGSEMDNAVRTYRNSLQPHYSGSAVTNAAGRWSWDVVQSELETMWRNERYWFTEIYKDLNRRKKVSGKKRDITTTRNELIQFLDIMERVNLH